MDVNGTRHILLAERELRAFTPLGNSDTSSEVLGSSAHSRAQQFDTRSEAVSWRPGLGLGLKVLPPDAPAAGRELDPLQRSRGAVDAFGNVYFVRREELRREETVDRLWVLPNRGPERRFTPSEPAIPRKGPFSPATRAAPEASVVRGLAVTSDHFLVVGSQAPPGLLVFDLHANGPGRLVRFEPDFEPHDLSASNDGGMWVLERRAVADRRIERRAVDPRIWRVPCGLPPPSVDADRALGPFSPTPEPSVEASHARRVATSLDDQTIDDPIAIAALAEGRALVLERGTDTHSSDSIVLLDERGPIDAVQVDKLLNRDEQSEARALHLLDIAVAAEEPKPFGERVVTAYLASTDGTTAYIARLVISGALRDNTRISGQLEPGFLPLAGYYGRAFFAHEGKLFYSTASEEEERRGVFRVAPAAQQLRRRFHDAGSFEARGQTLDSEIHGCVWHRLLVDGSLPEGCELTILARSGDDPAELSGARWIEQPPLMRRGGRELVFPIRAEPEVGTWELLLQAIRGRHIELRFELRGTGRKTPLIRAVRVHYPRFSYLREYLPAVFSEESESASFLERYLTVPEGILTEIEQRIANADALSDVRLAPRENLDWLASWIGVTLRPGWEPWRRRLAIAAAPLLVHERGTLRGLLRALRLATEECPRVGEGAPELTRRRGDLRIVEHAARQGPLPLSLDQAPTSGEWSLSDSSAELSDRYRAYYKERLEQSGALRVRHGIDSELDDRWKAEVDAVAQRMEFRPVVDPEDVEYAVWRDFGRTRISPAYGDVRGFTNESGRLAGGDLPQYRQYLSESYGSFEEYLEQWSPTQAQGFHDVAFPVAIPEGKAARRVWLDFVVNWVPRLRAAHRFSVFVPALPSETDAVIQNRLDRVRAIVEVEKPAHTDFDVRAFWDLFRVGEARVGIDAELGIGARLFAVVLDESRIGSGFLPGPAAIRAGRRSVAGRVDVGTSVMA